MTEQRALITGGSGYFGSLLRDRLRARGQGVRVFDRLRRFARAASLGGVESLASLPAFTSHASLGPDGLVRAGIAPGLIRLSIGLEIAEVLLADLRQALD